MKKLTIKEFPIQREKINNACRESNIPTPGENALTTIDDDGTVHSRTYGRSNFERNGSGTYGSYMQWEYAIACKGESVDIVKKNYDYT